MTASTDFIRKLLLDWNCPEIIHKDPIDNKPALAPMMVRWQIGDKLLAGLMVAYLAGAYSFGLSAIGPLWINRSEIFSFNTLNKYRFYNIINFAI